MKQFNIKLGLMFMSFIVSLLFIGCEKEEDPMAINIVDVNSYITGVDKTIAQPGDVVTFTGTNLDKVYKIMLNEENTTVPFKAVSSTQLEMTIPAAPPLGDVITINIFFSGKGLAQRAITLISPPVIYSMSPVAGHAGDVITVYGSQLHLYEQVLVGSVDVTSTIDEQDRSDKYFKLVLPEGFANGDDIIIINETGNESVSPYSLVKGIELLVTDFDENGSILGLTSDGGPNYSAYSNASAEVTTESFPRNSVYTITIEDNGSSWGANCDFTLENLPTGYDNANVDLVADIKASKDLSINMMIGAEHNPPPLWGLRQSITTDWKTIIVPLSEMGLGYGNDLPLVDPMYDFEAMKLIKFSLPANPADSYFAGFGTTITVDNVKLIVRD